MRIGALFGKIGSKFVSIAGPEIELPEQRLLARKIILAGGEHNGERLSELIGFSGIDSRKRFDAQAVIEKHGKSKKAK